jgi:hypothetical protein
MTKPIATKNERVARADNKFSIIKYQLMHHCFMNGLVLNDTQLSVLAYLGEVGKVRFPEFCKKICEKGILGSPQSASNVLGNLALTKLYVTEGVGKRMIYLNPTLNILTKGSILFSVKLGYLEPDQTAGNIPANSRKAELA